MIKKHWELLLLFLVFLNGCAYLDKVSYYEMRFPSGQNWQKSSVYYSYEGMPFKIHWNEYRADDVSIYISPKPEYGHSVAFSFSYLPVMVPNIFSLAYILIAPDNDSLALEAVFQCNKHNGSFDLSKADFIINNEQLSPSLILSNKITGDTTAYKTYLWEPGSYGASRVFLYKYSGDTITLKEESLHVVFRFPVKKNKVDDIKINLGQIIIDKDTKNVGELHLYRESTYLYDPAVFMRAVNH